MGRRPNNTTKSGRFMNPTDQQRKIDRAKELKRNKKQRNAVRQAIMKNRDADELIYQLRRIDDVELESDAPLRVSLADKREKVRKMFRETREFYQKDGDIEKVKEIDAKMQGYEQERYRKQQQLAAIKFSMTGDMDEIPMPMGMQGEHSAMTPFMPSYASSVPEPGLIVPTRGPVPPPPMRKRVRFAGGVKPGSGKTPGPPMGLPPAFSDSEDERDDDEEAPLHNEDDYAPVEIPDGMLDTEGGRDERRRVPAPILPPAYPVHNLAAAPPMHPSLLPMPPRMPLRMPPPPPGFRGGNVPGASGDGGPPGGPGGAVISAAPQVNARPGQGEERGGAASGAAEAATISAKPELRDLAKEAVKFVPTHLRVKRDTGVKKLPGRTNAMGMTTDSAMKKAAKTTDDAYAEFMKEMDGIL